MKDLKKECGLDVYLKDDFKLDLDIKLLGGEFSSCTIKDMQKVFKDKLPASDESLYYMYRDVRERSNDQKIKEHHLRYDLTVVVPRLLGSEFNKTYGHYHPLKEGTDLTYPEVYEVISGTAHYLLQKQGKSEDEIEEVYLVEVKSGEKVIIPPDFGHITINLFNAPLVMSNWVSDDFSSEYELYEKNHGGGYYICENPKSDLRPELRSREIRNPKQIQNQKFQIAKNEHYKKLPKLIMARPKELPRFALEFNQPMYITGTKRIKALKYLVNPEEFAAEIKPESVFSATG